MVGLISIAHIRLISLERWLCSYTLEGSVYFVAYLHHMTHICYKIDMTHNVPNNISTNTNLTNDPRWDRIWRHLEVNGKRAALQRIAGELPEGKGKVVSQQPVVARTLQVQFIAQLITARKRQHLSQAELATRIGVGRTTISRLETGQTSPSLAVIFRIIAALGLQVSVVEPICYNGEK